jgi:hypothetical protein
MIPLVKHKRLARIDVLGAVIPQSAAAKTDDPVAVVRYGKHQAVAETIVHASLIRTLQ